MFPGPGDALKDNRAPVSFIVYPAPGHSPADPIRSRDVCWRWTAWPASHLNDTPPGAQATH